MAVTLLPFFLCFSASPSLELAQLQNLPLALGSSWRELYGFLYDPLHLCVLLFLKLWVGVNPPPLNRDLNRDF